MKSIVHAGFVSFIFALGSAPSRAIHIQPSFRHPFTN